MYYFSYCIQRVIEIFYQDVVLPASDHKELEQKKIGDEWADTLREAPRPPM
jgi:hypothetical protein